MQDNSPAIILHGPITRDIQEHLNKSFGELPATLAARVEQAIRTICDIQNMGPPVNVALWWDASSTEQRNNAACASDKSFDLTPEDSSLASWHDYSMDASSWWGNESITPIYAALILSGHNPNKGADADMIEAAETTKKGGIGPREFRALKNKFEGASKDRPRTLKDWMEYAEQHKLKIHAWIGEWLQAGGAPLPVLITTHSAPASELVTPAAHRAKLDMSGERGARRRILEKWNDIEKEYGPSADGREVLRVLNRDADEKKVVLKTVQNHLSVLRMGGLIP